MWIGVDDTDSPAGGCTTWVLTELLDLARARGVDLIGEPRLVRLNPNVPWKTRGNAALSARFGQGKGRPRTVGEIQGCPVRAFPRGGPLVANLARQFREDAWNCVRERSSRAPDSDPALVASEQRLPARRYWEAVREVVAIEATVRELRAAGAWWRTRGGRRGLIGAAAAISWPGGRSTWEVTAYRAPGRWGSPRAIDAGSVREAARRHGSLFLCDDRRTRRLLVAPHTPCPILYGLRGTDPAELLAARREVRAEPVDRWILFRTNQASGDHLPRRSVGDLRAFTSGRITAIVGAPPIALPGGHVRISAVDPGGDRIDCIAFEPTKTLPRLLRALVPGDRIEVRGSRSRDPTLRLESVRVLGLAPRWGPARAPRCPRCDRPARSLGRGRGYRCGTCRQRWPPEAAQRSSAPRPELPRETHPTPSARRHLHPLAAEV
jgi:tRNA(Ile2)-agmatinylcytidine synthase